MTMVIIFGIIHLLLSVSGGFLTDAIFSRRRGVSSVNREMIISRIQSRVQCVALCGRQPLCSAVMLLEDECVLYVPGDGHHQSISVVKDAEFWQIKEDCPSGFKYLFKHGEGSSCYTVETAKESKQWTDVATECKSKKAFLVSLETAPEQEHIVKTIRENPILHPPDGLNTTDHFYWIGAAYWLINLNWMWNSGPCLDDTYTNWATGYPDMMNVLGKPRVAMEPGRSFQWTNRGVSIRKWQSWICEITAD